MPLVSLESVVGREAFRASKEATLFFIRGQIMAEPMMVAPAAPTAEIQAASGRETSAMERAPCRWEEEGAREAECVCVWGGGERLQP